MALAVLLLGAGVVLAIGAEPFASAERIRPASEVVDAAFDRIRGAGRGALVVGALVAGVLYALAAVYLGQWWRTRRGRGAPPGEEPGEPPGGPPA